MPAAAPPRPRSLSEHPHAAALHIAGANLEDLGADQLDGADGCALVPYIMPAYMLHGAGARSAAPRDLATRPLTETYPDWKRPPEDDFVSTDDDAPASKKTKR